MCVVYNGVECNRWQIGVVWMYGDDDTGILCSLKIYLPLLEVLGRVCVALFFFLFLFLSFSFSLFLFFVGTIVLFFV